jgi:outer membrane protein OmpA-like peptidoglycan-associated protein
VTRSRHPAGPRIAAPGSARAAAALLLGIGGLSAPVHAQVAVNPGALNQLRSHPAPHRTPAHRPAAQHRAAEPSATPSHPAPSHPAQSAPAAAAAPRVPAAPPNAAAIPPPAVTVPIAPTPPPPPIPVADDAPGAAQPVEGGLRITFGKDRSDLNPATVAAIQQVAAQAKARPGPLDLTAFAAGSPDDPSTPRRLSLARALAVRAILLREGIPSPRIYVRAEGTGATPGAAPSSAAGSTPSSVAPGDAALPLDRVDLVQQQAPAHAGPTPTTTAPTSSAPTSSAQAAGK